MRDIRNVGDCLVETAERDLADDPTGREGWTPLHEVLGSARIPPDLAVLLAQAVDKMVAAGDVETDSRWRALEFLLADFIAGA